MSYLILQMWSCLLLAAVIGAIFGYWIAKSSCRSKLDDLNASWKRKLEDSKQDNSQNFEADNNPAAAESTAATVSILEQTSYEVEEVEGIGPNYGKKLRAMGISNTEQLLNQCRNIDGCVTVAEQVGIEDFVIRKWASMSDLMRLNGIEGQFSELMVYAGIDSVQDLGKQNASALHSRLSISNQEQHRVESIPDEASLELMINQANSTKAIMQDG